MKIETFNNKVSAFETMMVAMVHDVVKEEGGLSPAVFFIRSKPGDPKDDIGILEIPEEGFHSKANKNITAMTIKEAIKDFKPYAIAFISESWVVDASSLSEEEQEELKSGRIAPADHPNRMDAVHISFETGTTCKMSSWIKKQENGQSELVDHSVNSEWLLKAEDRLQGIFTNLLEESYVDLEVDQLSKN